MAITWKFYNNINVHLEINKSNTQYGTKYQLGKDVFETIDDLLEKYIHRCNNIMVPILAHKKFKKGSESELENLLLEEKSKDANTIPFCLGCFEATPQFVAIFYFFGKEIVKEYVKIKPEGLFFHNAYFTSINMLIVWFKQNFKTQEYQAYLDRSKPLFCGKYYRL